MSKHPHKLILMNHKTWKCTLQGCSFFVHKGLEHILVGKSSICWGCGDEFLFDESALSEEMPKCIECRIARPSQPITETEVEEMTPAKRKLYKELGWTK
jgi:hypothetical protein